MKRRELERNSCRDESRERNGLQCGNLCDGFCLCRMKEEGNDRSWEIGKFGDRPKSPGILVEFKVTDIKEI